MKVIWKYELEHKGEDAQSIWMPHGAKILDVQMQGKEPVMWALVDSSVPMEERQFLLAWTGEERPDLDIAGYIGTFQAGPMVWHLFEEVE